MQTAYRCRVFDKNSEITMSVSIPGTTAGTIDLRYGFETGSLQPPSGSSHSQSFQIATTQGITGYQAYMGLPQGEHGRFDTSTFQWTVGRFSIPVGDFKTDAGNANRWMTAFIATTNDSRGNNLPTTRLLGRKVAIWESTDSANWSNPNHSSWKIWFVGRITNVTLSNLLTYTVEVSDSYPDWNGEIFGGIPQMQYLHSSSLGPSVIWETTTPAGGLTNNLWSAHPTSGSWSDNTLSSYLPFIPMSSSGFTGGHISKKEENSPWYNYADSGSNHHHRRFTPAFGTPGINRSYVYEEGGMFEHITGTTEARHLAAIYTWGETFIGILGVWQIVLNDTGGIGEIWMDDLYQDSSYTPISESLLPQYPIDCKVVLYQIPGKTWVGPISPAKHLQDICNGAYSTGFRKHVSDPTNFDSVIKQIPLVTDSVYDTLDKEYNCLFAYTQATDAMPVIESILNSFGYGYCIEPVEKIGAVVAPYNQMRLFSVNDNVTTAGLYTITDADVVASIAPQVDFTLKPVTTINTKFYVEQQNVYASTDTTTERHPTTMVTNPRNIIYQDGDVYKATNSLALDFNGMRVVSTAQRAAATTNLKNTAERFVINKANTRGNRFGWNPNIVTLTCNRSTDINALKIGGYVITNITTLPNSFVTRRGGLKIMQILGKTSIGVTTTLKLMDVSRIDVAAPPVVGGIRVMHTYQALVDITGSAASQSRVEVQMANLPSASGYVHATSSLWTGLPPVYFNSASASQSVMLGNYPTDTDISVRARTVWDSTSDKLIPSAWVTSSMNPFHTPALTAATTLTITNISAAQATMNWVNTNDDLRVEIHKASPPTASYEWVTILPAGTTTHTLTGLDFDADPQHKVMVRYIDAFSGYSPWLEGSFTASGSLATLPVPNILLFYSGTYVPPDTSSVSLQSGCWYYCYTSAECPTVAGNLTLGWGYNGHPTVSDTVDIYISHDSGSNWSAVRSSWPMGSNYISDFYLRKTGTTEQFVNVKVVYGAQEETGSITSHMVNSTPCPAV